MGLERTIHECFAERVPGSLAKQWSVIGYYLCLRFAYYFFVRCSSMRYTIKAWWTEPRVSYGEYVSHVSFPTLHSFVLLFFGRYIKEKRECNNTITMNLVAM